MSESEIERLYAKIDRNGRRYTTVPIHAPGETRMGFPRKGSRGFCLRRDGIGVAASKNSRNSTDEDRSNGHPANPRKINYADDHLTKKLQDIWTFKDPVKPIYPTEKNREMLSTIVRASSDEDSFILDCFAGSEALLSKRAS